jgi:sec-independent protein translocase protein TatA
MKFGVQELIIILLIVIIVFGPTQIPKLKKMFKKSTKDIKDAVVGKDDDQDA